MPVLPMKIIVLKNTEFRAGKGNCITKEKTELAKLVMENLTAPYPPGQRSNLVCAPGQQSLKLF